MVILLIIINFALHFNQPKKQYNEQGKKSLHIW